MKKAGQPFISFGIICFILLFVIFYLYDYYGYHRYTYYGKHAPIPTELHPIVAEKMETLLLHAEEKEIPIIIIETIRSFERQDKLYAKGRTEDGNIVTYARAGESYHNYGLAIDFAIQDSTGHPVWDIHYDGNQNNIADIEEIVAIAKELGFEWGGDWKKFKDYPHLQMTFGLSIHELQRGLRPKTE